MTSKSALPGGKVKINSSHNGVMCDETCSNGCCHNSSGTHLILDVHLYCTRNSEDGER